MQLYDSVSYTVSLDGKWGKRRKCEIHVFSRPNSWLMTRLVFNPRPGSCFELGFEVCISLLTGLSSHLFSAFLVKLSVYW